MTETRPQRGPSGSRKTAMRTTATLSTPSAVPPRVSATAGAQGGRSRAAGAAPRSSGAAPLLAAMGDAAPVLRPTAGALIGISAWQEDKRIAGLWSINQNRNSWLYVDGIGWRKLANNSDSAIVALTMLGAHAREKGSIVNYREESDGMIYEMYVWY